MSFSNFENEEEEEEREFQSSTFQPTTSQKKSGRQKKIIWNQFGVIGSVKSGHSGAKCLYCYKEWKHAKSKDLEDHIALNCLQVSATIKKTFLEIVKNRNLKTSTTSLSETSETLSGKWKWNIIQPSITTFYEPIIIDSAKEIRCTQALTKFFVCYGIPFGVVENPFFLDFVQSLYPGYKSPRRTKLSSTLINSELAHVILNTEEELKNEKNLTLGK